MRHNGSRVAAQLAALVLACGLGGPALADAPSAERQGALIHLVRQDCGSCHGLTLRGGLGPALTAPALRNFTVDLLAATILHGRPGTPMPPFAGIVTPGEAVWIARQLLAGFPEGR